MDSLINNGNKNIHNFPLCVRPWFHFGLGWNKHNACCTSYNYDFGNIKDTPSDIDIQIVS